MGRFLGGLLAGFLLAASLGGDSSPPRRRPRRKKRLPSKKQQSLATIGKDVYMTEIKKTEGAAPEAVMRGLQNVCGNLSPVFIPTPNFSTGIVSNYFKNIKVRQMRETVEEIMKIEQARSATLEAQLNQAERITLYSERIKNSFVQFDTERTIMQERAKQETEKTKQEIQITSRWEALAKQETIKVNLMILEAKELEMKIRIKEKEYEKEYGTSTVKGGDE